MERLTINGLFCDIAQCSRIGCSGATDKNQECDSKRIYERLRKLEEEAELVSDRDCLKIRAEALERAIKQCIPCYVCKNKQPDCDGCEIWLGGPGDKSWQFDEVRFVEKGGRDR